MNIPYVLSELPKLNNHGRVKLIIETDFTENEIIDGMYISQGEIKLKPSIINKLEEHCKKYYTDVVTKTMGWNNTNYNELVWKGTTDSVNIRWYRWQILETMKQKCPIKVVIPVKGVYSWQNIMNIMLHNQPGVVLNSYSISGNNLIKDYDMEPLKAYVFDSDDAFICLESKTQSYKFYRGSRHHLREISAVKFLEYTNKMLKMDDELFDLIKVTRENLSKIKSFVLDNYKRRSLESAIWSLENYKMKSIYSHMPEDIKRIVDKCAVVELASKIQ